ncbi:unnamed protein product, partial [marine sediment metagenome]
VPSSSPDRIAGLQPADMGSNPIGTINIGRKDMNLKHYLFVIDTNRYSGNFEREMCAYMTGQLQECRRGDELAEIAEKEIPEEVEQFEEIIAWVWTEWGRRSVDIFPNPNHKNEFGGPDFCSVAIYFNSIPDLEQIMLLKERARKYSSLHLATEAIKIEGFRLFAYYDMYKEIKGNWRKL